MLNWIVWLGEFLSIILLAISLIKHIQMYFIVVLVILVYKLKIFVGDMNDI